MQKPPFIFILTGTVVYSSTSMAYFLNCNLFSLHHLLRSMTIGKAFVILLFCDIIYGSGFIVVFCFYTNDFMSHNMGLAVGLHLEYHGR